MIKPGEIPKAREAEVRDQQIKKGYILSWILKGVPQHEQLSKSIVFKGWLCIKENLLPFPVYRFIEDLDFALCGVTRSPMNKRSCPYGTASLLRCRPASTNFESFFGRFKKTGILF